MSLSMCTSCLARLHISTPAVRLLPVTTTTATSSFHSSAIQQNVVKKKTVAVPGARKPQLRQSRSARINKKKRERPKPPPVGERKAQRTRIVLSNTNALEIHELVKLNVENMTDAEQIGKVLSLDGPVVDQLRDAKAFKTTQNWNMFRTPSTLMRSETVECALDMEDVETAVDHPPTLHKLVTGQKASGKSVHVVQAMSLAYMRKWIVINIPDGQEYVLNQSAYAPVPKSDDNAEQMYVQPRLASDILTRLAYSNDHVLSSLRLVHDHSSTLSKPTTGKLKSLKELALLGVNDYRMAPQVWEAVWKELSVKPSKESANSTRPPILIAIDGINFWMGETLYKSAEYKPIHAHQFTLVKQFLDLLFPASANVFPYGGIVLACTTKSNHPTSTSFDHLTQAIEHRQNNSNEEGQSPQPWSPDLSYTDPYLTKMDHKVWDLRHRIQYTDIVNLKGLSRPESKGLLEYFAQSGIFKEAVTDGAVAEKWSLSGGGIVGELCKLGTRLRTGIFETVRREGIKMRV